MRKPKKPRTSKTEMIATSSAVVGSAYEMPEAALGMMALVDETPPDFQARQDKISETRRSPGPELMPKIKRTSAKPSRAKETRVKL